MLMLRQNNEQQIDDVFNHTNVGFHCRLSIVCVGIDEKVCIKAFIDFDSTLSGFLF